MLSRRRVSPPLTLIFTFLFVLFSFGKRLDTVFGWNLTFHTTWVWRRELPKIFSYQNEPLFQTCFIHTVDEFKSLPVSREDHLWQVLVYRKFFVKITFGSDLLWSTTGIEFKPEWKVFCFIMLRCKNFPHHHLLCEAFCKIFNKREKYFDNWELRIISERLSQSRRKDPLEVHSTDPVDGALVDLPLPSDLKWVLKT